MEGDSDAPAAHLIEVWEVVEAMPKYLRQTAQDVACAESAAPH
ncbi:MAG TPA: hypothetical protein VGN15_09910 [Ktedonobacteraceae bacterium]|jgi:hypothetical protein|nr:hypothetical protein [Ktedonobacteraceae bacterium]